MIAALFLLMALPAEAAERHVVRNGETVSSIAATTGRADRVDELRALNHLDAGAEPAVGTILVLPDTGERVDQEAALIYLSGTVRVTLPSGALTAPAEGLALPGGTLVCTGERAFAGIRLAVSPDSGEHDDLNLLSDTCVTITGATGRAAGRSSYVAVSSGSIAVRAAPGLPGDVVITTPSGVTTSEHGGFRVTLEPDASRTEATDGPVAVIGAGVEVAVPEGYGSRIRQGEAPSAPVALLAPGAPVAPDAGDRLVHLDFTWVPVERALGYRIELATNPDFSAPVYVEDTPDARWQPPTLLLPETPAVWWRVASFDRTGFLGKPSDVRELAIPDAGTGAP